MSREDAGKRSPPQPRRITPPNAGQSDAYPHRTIRFSLRSLAILLTASCVLLGIDSMTGGSASLLIANFLIRTALPTAVVVAAIYTRGGRQTFFIGAAVALAVQIASTDGPRIRLGTGVWLATLGAAVQLLLLTSAGGALAVATRRWIERREWNRPDEPKGPR